jgi:NitT/TauT family transport system substrate-binding protein
MTRANWSSLAGLLVAASLALPGCGGGGASEGEGKQADGTGTEEQAEMDSVTLQLNGVTEARFAGYYAAQDQGYYVEERLDVTIRPGGPDIVPEQVVLGGQAEFGLNWLDSTLATRDQGGDIVNIAQVFTRSGMTEITLRDSGIDDIRELRGKKVGVWLGGNEHKLFAALNKSGLDPMKDVQIVAQPQPFDMNLFVNRQIDAAAAMTYNELALVLEQENPDTGELYTLDELNVFKMSDLGTGALEDGVFVRAAWIQDEENRDVAKRFLTASFRGWVYCRDNQEECLQIVLENGPTLGEGRQRWQLNEINDLIWPAPLGIGIMDPESYRITWQIALDYAIIKNPPDDARTYRTDLAEAAVAELKSHGVDVTGESWQKAEVEVTPGGE